MPSLKSRLLTLFVRATRRKFVSDLALLEDISRRRKVGPARPSARMQRHISVQHDVVAGVEVYRLAPKHPGDSGSHVVYLHGGAYVCEVTVHHWNFLQRLVEETGCTVSVPLYPLAPEATCSSTVGAVVDVYQRLHAESRNPIVMGDSAGGGLAVALCYALRKVGAPMPASLVLICPWVDVAMTNPKMGDDERFDPMLSIDALKIAGRFYAGEEGVAHPCVSPINGDFKGLPDTLLFVGTRDILSHDAIEFANQAKGEGVAIELLVGKDMIHVWPILPIPEARKALSRIAKFITARSNLAL